MEAQLFYDDNVHYCTLSRQLSSYSVAAHFNCYPSLVQYIIFMFVISGPPSNVTLRELNSTSVEVTWSESFFPPTVTLERYSITVFNTSGSSNHQQQIYFISDVGPPTSDGRYSRIFSFGQGLAQCTQITFSVTSISSIGTSPASNVSWERPLYIGEQVCDNLILLKS